MPAPRNALIGRDRDLADVQALLLNGPERLVTLVGMGGSGKTQLALAVARAWQGRHAGEVILVELASVSDPLLVPQIVTRGLGNGGKPFGADDLATAVESRSLLLVLDNCEHLIDACARLADDLLSSCPQLRILATSREPLKIAGELRWLVRPLELPNPSQLSSVPELARCPSVRLFVERAKATAPDFACTNENSDPVVQICSLLGGLPLAIELVAPMVAALSPFELADRLRADPTRLASASRSLPQRQQTLEATLDWSYQLLSEPERAVYRQLSVFAAGCTLEAAEAVCASAACTGSAVLEILACLRDKSLLLVDNAGNETRYRMLEPVRAYAMRQLVRHGELDATQARLFAYCVATAEKAEPELHGPRQSVWLRRLDAELDNVRSVVAWASHRGDAESAFQLGAALHWYFWRRGHLREEQRWLQAAREADGVVPTRVRANALGALCDSLGMSGDYQQGLACGREALALYRRLEDFDGLAHVTQVLAEMTLASRDLATAKDLASEAVAFARASAKPWFLPHSLVVLGRVLRRHGALEEAVTALQQAVSLFDKLGDHWAAGWARVNLSAVRGKPISILQTAAISNVRWCWENGDDALLAAALEYVAIRAGGVSTESQVQLLAATAAARAARGAPLPATEHADLQRVLDEAREAIGLERFAAVWSAGAVTSLDELASNLLGHDSAGRPVCKDVPGRSPSIAALTPREEEVVSLLLQGCTDRQIAQALTITEGSARQHVHHILRKLGLRSRFQVGEWAQRRVHKGRLLAIRP